MIGIRPTITAFRQVPTSVKETESPQEYVDGVQDVCAHEGSPHTSDNPLIQREVTKRERRALSAMNGFRPDVLVSDIGMPDEDGYSLIRQVRARGVDHGGSTPAIALTGYVTTEDRARLLAAGFQIHLRKPVDPSEIVAAVASLMTIEGR